MAFKQYRKGQKYFVNKWPKTGLDQQRSTMVIGDARSITMGQNDSRQMILNESQQMVEVG